MKKSMNKIEINIEQLVNYLVRDGHIDKVHKYAYCKRFSVWTDGGINIDFPKSLAEMTSKDVPIVTINPISNGLLVDLDCVAKVSSKDTLPIGGEKFDYILTPKGYALVRHLFAAEIEKSKPIYRCSFNSYVTMDRVDEEFNLSWNKYLKNCKKLREKLKSLDSDLKAIGV